MSFMIPKQTTSNRKSKNFLLLIIIFSLALLYYSIFDIVYQSTIENVLNVELENAKTQSNIIRNILDERLNSGNNCELVKNEFQRSIENTSTENMFVCMFDSTGKEICHPNINKVGKVLSKNNSIIKSQNNKDLEYNFKNAVISKLETGGIRELKEYSEIVYLSPLQKKGWIVASHLNYNKLIEILSNLRMKLIFVFLISWLITIIVIYSFLNHYNQYNLAKLTELNKKTSDEHFHIIKNLRNKQNQELNRTNENKELNRFLADRGAKLVPIHIDNIAIIFTEDKITYIVEHDNKQSTINTSLDEMMLYLDKTNFYRASRNVIVSARSIDKIEKLGNTQLRVFTKPSITHEIKISKAKIVEFKKWLGKY